MLDDRAVVLVRFYREAAANGELLPVLRRTANQKQKYIICPMTNDGCKFEWVQTKSALCNAQMTKMQRLDPRYAGPHLESMAKTRLQC